MELMHQNNQLAVEAEKKIIEYKQNMKLLKDQEKEFNERLLAEMKRRKIISYKDNNLSISLIGGMEKEIFDTESFKKQYPKIYNMFLKKTPVKESVRVTIKKGITAENMSKEIEAEVQQITINGEVF